MIAICRKTIQALRTVLRRALKITPRGPDPSVHFIADADSLVARAMTAHGAVEYRLPGGYQPTAFWVPFTGLSRWQGKGRDLVKFELAETGELSVTWIEGNVPQHQLLTAGEPESVDFPPMPAELVASPPNLLKSLQAAAAATDDASGRYALGCLHLRGGKQGRVAGTDGRHLFMHSGFAFPWSGDLLVPGSQVFGAADLPAQAVRVGASENWATFCVGPWTIHLPIRKEGRYPRVEDSIPPVSFATAKLLVEKSDARFLAQALPKMPCAVDDQYSRITVDLDGEASLRSRDTGPTTELALSNSFVRGQARVSINRKYLMRAIDLGFREVWFFENVMACIDGDRTYAWAHLDASGVISSRENAIRVESPKIIKRETTAQAA